MALALVTRGYFVRMKEKRHSHHAARKNAACRDAAVNRIQKIRLLGN